jgi:hypothetical protein
MATALRIHAGRTALRHLREQGLRPQDVRVVPAAAGGPKGLVLNPLDRFIFGSWLAASPQTVHLVGASIGAWRMASACLADADSALAEMAEAYVTQQYPHRPGRGPLAKDVSSIFGGLLATHLGQRAGEVLAHPARRLHVVTCRGRHLLRRDGRLRTPLGYAGVALSNIAHRRLLGLWLERVLFSDPREALPLPLSDLGTRRVALDAGNLGLAVQASCSIPFWLDAVHDIPGAPRGAYWDGGITDYHLHWNYAALGDGIALYPHFQTHIVPGWLDKGLRRRHRYTAWLDRLVVLAPDPQWITTLPDAKLPDREDFKAHVDDDKTRMMKWRRALAESQRLADEFADVVLRGGPIDAEPLAAG